MRCNSLEEIEKDSGLVTNCTIEALSKEGGLDDGFRSPYVSLDEIHQMRNNQVYKALYNGTKSLPETLVTMITTRGFNLDAFCFEIDKLCQSILYGNETAEDFFIDIYFNELLSHSFLHAVTVENSFGQIKIDKQPGRKNS